MASASMRVEDILDGASNFLSWKARVTLALKRYVLWELVEKAIVSPTDLATLATHEKKEIKVERVILDSVKDHLIPHLSEKKTDKEMFDALVGLFRSTNMNRKMALRNKLKFVQMSRSNNVTSYFMRITQVRDQLATIGEKMDDVGLVNVVMNGLRKSWEPFVKGVCAGENLPDWQRLWDDCIQEETREEFKSSKQGSSDENSVLVSKTRKGKGKSSNKKGSSDGGSLQPGKKKDLSKIKCFSCHKNGHYASQCPKKKKGKGKTHTATSAKTQLDEFAVKFEKDFSLVYCLSTSTSTRSVWYLDSGASRYMTEAWELFSNLIERDSDVHVELGDDAKYAVKGEGTVMFQHDSRGSFDAQKVLYVPRLKKNLLSVSAMEDRGFCFYFSEMSSTHTSKES
jgi:hypothetical protein